LAQACDSGSNHACGPPELDWPPKRGQAHIPPSRHVRPPMGLAKSKTHKNQSTTDRGLKAGASASGPSARGIGSAFVELYASRYQQRVLDLAREAVEAPALVPIEQTLRECIAFCYGVSADWAPHVRVTVFADNPAEHQTNVPVYEALLCAWGVPNFREAQVSCRAIRGTDVSGGYVCQSSFWRRIVEIDMQGSREMVVYHSLIHQLLNFFVCLPEQDARKQLLVNIILQLHEACFNCIGRHKEVFEYCIYDLIDAEDTAAYSVSPAKAVSETEVDRAKRIIRRFAAHFLDQHKRAALHAAVLSPLKFLFQNKYEVFENIDSHGASFWVAVFSQVFFPGLQMPFESIVGLDGGWAWGAVDFMPSMQDSDAKEALRRFSSIENLGRDWRLLAKGLHPPLKEPRRLAGLPIPTVGAFEHALKAAAQPGRLRNSLEPYAARFAMFMHPSVVSQRCVLAASTSPMWDTMLGPSLASLCQEALGHEYSPDELRQALVGSCVDAGAIELNASAMMSLMQAAEVPWAVMKA